MQNKLCVQVWTPDHNQNQLFRIHITTCFLTISYLAPTTSQTVNLGYGIANKYFGAIAYALNPHMLTYPVKLETLNLDTLNLV